MNSYETTGGEDQSYFISKPHTQVWNPAGAVRRCSLVQNGGFKDALFGGSPVGNLFESLPVVKIRVTSPVKREVAGAIPVTG